MDILLSFLIVGGVIGVMDALWLTLAAKRLYSAEVGNIMRNKPNVGAAAAFYIIYVIGVVVLIVLPDIHTNAEWFHTTLRGGLLGLFAYATFGLTNLSVFKYFTLKLVAIDMLWGTFMTAIAATIAVLIL